MNHRPVSLDAETLLAEASELRRLARRLVRDAAGADDLVQETWLAALRKKPEVRAGLRPWLAHVLRNFARERRRGDANRARREEIAARPELLPSADETAERLEAHGLLVDALRALAEPYRTTVTQRYLEGLSAAQIARRAGIPAGTVRWRLKQGMDELRARLAARSGGDRGRWALALLPLLRRPPLVEIVAAGASTALQGVLVMNTMARVGIAAAVLVTATIGVWIAVEDRSAPEPTLAGGEPAPGPVALSTPPDENAAPDLASGPGAGKRETVALEPEKPHPAPPASSSKARLDARFVDPEQAPLRGVRFQLVGLEDAEPQVSGSDGRIALEVELAGESLSGSFESSCPDRATLFETVVLDRGKTTHLGDLVLEIGGAVAGVVVGPDGSPLVGAEVLVTKPELSGRLENLRRLGPDVRPGVPSSRTADDGSFRVEGVPAQAVRVWAGAEGMRYSWTEPVLVRASKVRGGLALKLEELAREDRIEGIVRAEDGTPVPLATVGYSWHAHSLSSGSSSQQANAEGRFRIKVREPVPHDFRAIDPQGRWPEAVRFDVTPGTLDLVLQFSEPRRFELSVRAPGGAAVSRFAVVLWKPDGSGYLDAVNEGEHPKGKASVGLPGEPFRIEVIARGFATGSLGPFAPEAVPGELECELVSLPGVHGRVIAAGRPVAGARVELHPVALAWDRIEWNGFLTRVAAQREDRVTSDADGLFVLFLRESGRFAILCDAEGYATAELSPLDIDPAKGAEGIEIALSSGGSIEGRVLMPENRDPAGVIVGVNNGDGRPRTMRVGPDGAFRFEHLTSGRWEVKHAEKEVREGQGTGTIGPSRTEEVVIPWSCVVLEGRITRSDLDLRDEAPCVLAGHVSVNGQPAGGWTLTLSPESSGGGAGRAPGGAVDAHGNVRVEAREPGTYRIELHASTISGPDASFSDHIQLARGENAWQFEIATGVLEGGAVTFGTRPGAPPFHYTWKGKGELRFSVLFGPDEQGRFRLPLLPAGHGTIRRLEGNTPESMRWMTLREVEITAGEVQHMNLP